MAIFIQINKVAEFPDALIYEFGPVEEIIGRVTLYKEEGRVELFDMIPGAAGREGFDLPRISRALVKDYHAIGEYPERTVYKA